MAGYTARCGLYAGNLGKSKIKKDIQMMYFLYNLLTDDIKCLFYEKTCMQIIPLSFPVLAIHASHSSYTNLPEINNSLSVLVVVH